MSGIKAFTSTQKSMSFYTEKYKRDLNAVEKKVAEILEIWRFFALKNSCRPSFPTNIYSLIVLLFLKGKHLFFFSQEKMLGKYYLIRKFCPGWKLGDNEILIRLIFDVSKQEIIWSCCRRGLFFKEIQTNQNQIEFFELFFHMI